MPITNMISDCDNTLNKKLINYLVPILSALLCFSNDVIAQPLDNSARITVLSGGNVPFIFNSMDKWRNGISYPIPYGTTFEITYRDSVADGFPSDTWELRFRAMQATFVGDNPPNVLPLEILELTASDGGGFGAPPPVFSGPLELAVAAQTIVTQGPIAVVPAEANGRVLITYDCGRNLLAGPPADKELMELIPSAIPDYYVVDIEFTLTCVGCP